MGTYDPHGSGKFGKCRSNFQSTHMEVGSSENAWSDFQSTYMEVGSSENAWSNFQSTHMEVGSSENAWSDFQSTHMTRIVPTILLYLLHPWRSDVGSSENASLHGCNLLGQCRSSCQREIYQRAHFKYTDISYNNHSIK